MFIEGIANYDSSRYYNLWQDATTKNNQRFGNAGWIIVKWSTQQDFKDV